MHQISHSLPVFTTGIIRILIAPSCHKKVLPGVIYWGRVSTRNEFYEEHRSNPSRGPFSKEVQGMNTIRIPLDHAISIDLLRQDVWRIDQFMALPARSYQILYYLLRYPTHSASLSAIACRMARRTAHIDRPLSSNLSDSSCD